MKKKYKLMFTEQEYILLWDSLQFLKQTIPYKEGQGLYTKKHQEFILTLIGRIAD